MSDVREVVVGNGELERESGTLVRVTAGVEEVAGGRLEDGTRVEVGEGVGVIEDESGVD